MMLQGQEIPALWTESGHAVWQGGVQKGSWVASPQPLSDSPPPKPVFPFCPPLGPLSKYSSPSPVPVPAWHGHKGPERALSSPRLHTGSRFREGTAFAQRPPGRRLQGQI